MVIRKMVKISPLLPYLLQQVPINLRRAQRRRIAQDDQLTYGPGNAHQQLAIRGRHIILCQPLDRPDLPGIADRRGKNNDLPLISLVTLHRVYNEILITQQLSPQMFFDRRYLGPEGSNDTDVRRLSHPRLYQRIGDRSRDHRLFLISFRPPFPGGLNKEGPVSTKLPEEMSLRQGIYRLLAL